MRAVPCRYRTPKMVYLRPRCPHRDCVAHASSQCQSVHSEQERHPCCGAAAKEDGYTWPPGGLNAVRPGRCQRCQIKLTLCHRQTMSSQSRLPALPSLPLVAPRILEVQGNVIRGSSPSRRGCQETADRCSKLGSARGSIMGMEWEDSRYGNIGLRLGALSQVLGPRSPDIGDGKRDSPRRRLNIDGESAQ